MEPSALPSIQSLLVQPHFNDQKLGDATGFVVIAPSGKSYLITNWHVVSGRDPRTGKPTDKTNAAIPNKLVIHHNKMGHCGGKIVTTECLYAGQDEQLENPFWIEHPALGREVDVVALELTHLDGVELLHYDITNTRAEYETPAIGPADSVSVIGYPFGITGGESFAVWVNGSVASEPAADYDKKPMFLIDCRARPGQSGSPVIVYTPPGGSFRNNGALAISSDEISHFLGIYSGRVNEESDLGMVWKACVVEDILKDR